MTVETLPRLLMRLLDLTALRRAEQVGSLSKRLVYRSPINTYWGRSLCQYSLNGCYVVFHMTSNDLVVSCIQVCLILCGDRLVIDYLPFFALWGLPTIKVVLLILSHYGPSPWMRKLSILIDLLLDYLCRQTRLFLLYSWLRLYV